MLICLEQSPVQTFSVLIQVSYKTHLAAELADLAEQSALEQAERRLRRAVRARAPTAWSVRLLAWVLPSPASTRLSSERCNSTKTTPSPSAYSVPSLLSPKIPILQISGTVRGS